MMQDYALTHCGHGKRRGEPCEVCDRLDAAHEKIVAENAKLRAELAEAQKKVARLERFIAGVEAVKDLSECPNCGAAVFRGLLCGMCGNDANL